VPDRLPEVLVVARIPNGGGRHALDRFVSVPRYPWSVPNALDMLVRESGTIDDQEVVTAYGEVVRAELTDMIWTQFLDGPAEPITRYDSFDGSAWQVLKDYLAPRRALRPTTPELFTWSSAFNSARDEWPGVSGLEQLVRLTPTQQAAIANQFLGYGLEALAAESENMSVCLAAQRLVELCDRGFIDLHLTSQPYEALQELTGRDRESAGSLLPEEHGLVYLRASDSEAGSESDPSSAKRAPDRKGTILVPFQWVAAALQREIVALVHLVRAASFARDDSFGKLSGSAFGHSRELRVAAEIPLSDVAVARADRLASRFLHEALRFDTRVYGLQVQRDEYCRAIEGIIRPIR
jgi:hypothetical protein